jgi:hypothetical protein
MPFSGGSLILKGVADATLLTTQTAVVATGSNGIVNLPRPLSGFVCELDVTSAATLVGDTLDVFIQNTLDQNAKWTDAVHFSQILGNGGAKRYLDKIVCNQTVNEFEVGSALGAGTVRHLFGDQWRCRWVVAGGSPSFTFTVWMTPL